METDLKDVGYCTRCNGMHRLVGEEDGNGCTTIKIGRKDVKKKEGYFVRRVIS